MCVVAEHGRIVEGGRYRHNEAGIRALCSRLVRLDVKLVALERPDGLLIDRLLDAGLAVIAVHPNQVKASRPRYSVAGGKSDGFDSFVLAELARTDSHRFRVLVPDGDQTKALRAMTRARGTRPHPAWSGQPAARSARDVLAGCEQGVLKRRLADRAGVPAAAIPLRSTPAASVSSAWRRSSNATAIPAASRPASCSDDCGRGAEGRAGELEMQARRGIVLALVSALEPIVARISELTIQIRHALDAHPDGPTFRSLFIDPDSWLCAASMLAEIGDCRDRYPTYRALAADGGQCPVAVESGKAKRAQFRWACDHRLRQAFDVLVRLKPPPQPVGGGHL